MENGIKGDNSQWLRKVKKRVQTSKTRKAKTSKQVKIKSRKS